MNIFSKFMKKKNKVEDIVNKLLQDKQIENLEKELLKVNISHLNEIEQKSLHTYLGMAAFKRGERTLAFKRFKEAAKKYPDDSVIQFCLGQEYEYKGEIDTMLECFNKAKFPQVSAMQVLTEARYLYLWDKVDEAISCIDPIFNLYFNLKIVDVTFLHIRSLPSFSEIWNNYVCFYWMKGNLEVLREKISRCKKELRDYDFTTDELELEALIKNDFAKVISIDNEIIKMYKKNNWSYSMVALQKTVFECRLSKNYKEATILLNSIDFKMDFSWIDNVIILMRAEIACKYYDEPVEKDMLNQFFKEEPLLLEPKNAAFFNFLAYQEKLKKIYTNSRKNGSNLSFKFRRIQGKGDVV